MVEGLSFQFVENAMSVKCNKVRCNKMKYIYIIMQIIFKRMLGVYINFKQSIF